MKRFIAAVMALIMCITSIIVVSANQNDESDAQIQTERPESMSVTQYKSRLRNEGVSVFSTEQFLVIHNFFQSVIGLMTGNGFKGNYFDVTVDEFVTDACNHVYMNCGLDIVSLLTNLPAANDSAELITKVFNIDVETIREEMYNKRDTYYAEGNDVMGTVCFFLGAYLAIMDKCEIQAVQTEEDPNVYEVQLKVTYRNGTYDTHCPGIYINKETGECTGHDKNSGLLNIGFNFNLGEMMVYATIDSWMRDFGFCLFYDIAAGSMPALWNYDTRRFRFEYDGLEWMIQMWKGNYLITNGAEVGVYNRPPEKFGTYYDCASDEQLMEMTLQVYHGEDLLVNQEPQLHWWINGFQMSDRLYLPSSLTLVSSIVMPDEEMLNAFCESIDNHFLHDVTYSVDGLKITFIW